MSLDELQVRGWIKEWEDWYNSAVELSAGPKIIAVKGREGVKDFNFSQYDSIAYEIQHEGKVVARAEGRDARERITIVMNRLQKDQFGA